MLDSGADFVHNPAGVLRGAVELQHTLGMTSHSSTRLLDANPNDTLVSRRSSLTFWLKLILGSVLPQWDGCFLQFCRAHHGITNLARATPVNL